jgi:hypothetical protein
MKITLDKQVITLNDAKQAEEIRTEWNEYIKGDKDFIFSMASTAIRANYNKNYNPERLISIDKIEVTKNHYELSVWIECIVEYDYQTIIKVNFDGLQALQYSEGEHIDANLYIYKTDNKPYNK